MLCPCPDNKESTILYKSDNVDKIIDELGEDRIITKYILHEMIGLFKQNNRNQK